jgi:hypothetical protein
VECYLQGIYRPRDAQATALYHLVKDNFDELDRVWDDRYEKMFQSLVNSGQLALEQPALAEGGRGGRGGAGQSARLWSANAHYLIGLGCLGLGDTAKAKAELAQAVEISPDLLGARTALAALK